MVMARFNSCSEKYASPSEYFIDFIKLYFLNFELDNPVILGRSLSNFVFLLQFKHDFLDFIKYFMKLPIVL